MWPFPVSQVTVIFLMTPGNYVYRWVMKAQDQIAGGICCLQSVPHLILECRHLLLLPLECMHRQPNSVVNIEYTPISDSAIRAYITWCSLYAHIGGLALWNRSMDSIFVVAWYSLHKFLEVQHFTQIKQKQGVTIVNKVEQHWDCYWASRLCIH